MLVARSDRSVPPLELSAWPTGSWARTLTPETIGLAGKRHGPTCSTERVSFSAGSMRPARPMNRARGLWTSVGATTQWIDPAEHDQRLAWTSHLPQFASTSIALALAERGLGPDALGPGGRDVTRLAGSSPDLWRGIARDNADNLLEALDGVLHQLAALRAAVASGDDTTLGSSFDRAAGWSANARG
jgi:prephenate dehydrogenase